MKKLILYATVCASYLLFYACGNPQNDQNDTDTREEWSEDNMDNMGDPQLRDGDTSAIDTLQDSLLFENKL